MGVLDAPPNKFQDGAFMLRWITFGLFLISSSVHAGATLTDTRFTSCTNNICIEIKSHKAYQGSLGTAAIYFARPIVRLTDSDGLTQTWQAESVYFESVVNRLFIRAMQHRPSGKQVEAYYELQRGKLFIIQGSAS